MSQSLVKNLVHLVNRLCFALSGLVDIFETLSQGVALGWFVDAPSGRQKMKP